MSINWTALGQPKFDRVVEDLICRCVAPQITPSPTYAAFSFTNPFTTSPPTSARPGINRFCSAPVFRGLVFLDVMHWGCAYEPYRGEHAEAAVTSWPIVDVCAGQLQVLSVIECDSKQTLGMSHAPPSDAILIATVSPRSFSDSDRN